MKIFEGDTATNQTTSKRNVLSQLNNTSHCADRTRAGTRAKQLKLNGEIVSIQTMDKENISVSITNNASTCKEQALIHSLGENKVNSNTSEDHGKKVTLGVYNKMVTQESSTQDVPSCKLRRIGEITSEEKLRFLMSQIESLFKGQNLMNENINNFQTIPIYDTLGNTEPYKLDMLQYELKKETKYNFTLVFPKEYVDERCTLVQDLMSIVKKNGFDEETLHSSTYIADAFLLKANDAIRKNINWKLLALVVICIAAKLQYGNQFPLELCTLLLTRKSNQSLKNFAEMERLILNILDYDIRPPTGNTFKELVMSQMNFPTPMTQWLISDTVSKVLKDSLLYYKLVTVPSSNKAKCAIQVCTKYFMDNFETFHFLSWDEKRNVPIDLDINNSYFKALKTVAMSRCMDEFLDHFFPIKQKVDLQKRSLCNLNISSMQIQRGPVNQNQPQPGASASY